MNIYVSKHWNNILKAFPEEKLDIYYFEEYVNLYKSDNVNALCIICEEEDKIALMPFLRSSWGGFYDFETPYGYGGPICLPDKPEWMQEAVNGMKKWFFDNHYLCGLVRFHPLLGNASKNDSSDVFLDRHTIMVDADMLEEEIWNSQITSKNRNMIRKAEKNGCTYEVDNALHSIDDFVELYNETMDRVGADSFFFFDKEYYDGLKQLNKVDKAGCFLSKVVCDGRMVAGALFIYYGIYGHYHLAGTRKDMNIGGSSNFLLWNSIKEMQRKGVKYIHLGGGTNGSEDNALYKYKKSFSNLTKEYYIGKWIFEKKAYMKICKEWEKTYPDKNDSYEYRLMKYKY